MPQAINIEIVGGDPPTIIFAGDLSTAEMAALQPVLEKHAANPRVRWDLTNVSRLDTLVALLILDFWGSRLPTTLIAKPDIQNRLTEALGVLLQPPIDKEDSQWVRHAHYPGSENWLQYLRSVAYQLAQFAVRPGRISSEQLTGVLARSGLDGIFVVSLVGFLIGIVVSYLGVLQLASYGAETLIVQVLGMGIFRELGPVLAAIVVAGRSGSAIAAELAGMRMSQELDTLESHGIDLTQRLVVPRLLSLIIATPLLTAIADLTGLVGGMLATQQATDMRAAEFLFAMPAQVPLVDLFVGLGKSVVFGGAIAIVACFYGLRATPDATGLASATTSAVVVCVVSVLVLDAAFAMLLHNVG